MSNPKRGRPATIDPVRIAELRQNPERWTWAQIAEKMGIAESSAIRVFSKYRQAGAGDSIGAYSYRAKLTDAQAAAHAPQKLLEPPHDVWARSQKDTMTTHTRID